MIRAFYILPLLLSLAAPAVAESTSVSGSEITSEKVCLIGLEVKNEFDLIEAIRKCQKGDILDIAMLRSPYGLQFCDFTKTILYNQTDRSIIACVYSGTRRQVRK